MESAGSKEMLKILDVHFGLKIVGAQSVLKMLLITAPEIVLKVMMRGPLLFLFLPLS